MALGRPPRRALLAAAAGLVLAACWGDPRTRGKIVRLDMAPGSDATVVVEGLDRELLAELDDLPEEEWREIFPVYTGQEIPEEGEGKPAILGSYAVEGGVVRFRPRFPLIPGLAYCARFDLGRAGVPPLGASFQLALGAVGPSAEVTALYPTAEELPENLLRLYIHFSAPMSRGEAYERIHLFNEDGEVEAPFVEITQELWDPEMRRLTILFDPGRIKRGLRPHDEVGPPLEAGHSYRLAIDAEWLDGSGRPLREGFEKTFRVTSADRTSPDVASWRLEAPRAGSREALALSFPEPLDRALLLRLLRPLNAEGRQVAGRSEVTDGERRWTFTPDEPWRAGSYGVEVETILEDLAGNSLRQVFDVDLTEPAAPGVDEKRISLPFTVAAE